MDKKELAEKYKSYLAEQGYRPAIDDDNDVIFKNEGLSYIIIADPKDESFFRIICPGIWSVDSDEKRIRALRAYDVANASTKVAKMYTVGNSAWASAEIFLSDPEAFKGVFQRLISTLQLAMSTFSREMTASTAATPAPVAVDKPSS